MFNLPPPSIPHMMQHLKGHHSVVCNQSIQDECTLCIREIFGRMFFNQLARTFKTNREITFAKLMGRYFVMCCGSFFLGISSIWVKFIFRRLLPEWRTDSMAEVTSGPTMLQNFWKKNWDIPSGLGAFDGCILEKCCSHFLGHVGLEQWISYVIDDHLVNWVQDVL